MRCIIIGREKDRKLIEEIPRRQLEEAGYKVEVIVINNKSTDKTRDVALQYGATVIDEPRQGKGMAVKTAFTGVEADFYFMLDADYTYPPSYIISMLQLLEHNDVVTGSRFKRSRQKRAFSCISIIGNIMLTLFATILYQRYTSDLCTGYWGFKREVVKQLCLDDISGFELEAKLFSEVVKKRYSLAEIPIEYRERLGGPTKLRPFRDGLRVVRTLIASRISS